MDMILEVAISAAKSAGEFIQKSAQNLSSIKVEQKSLHDYVSEVDRGAEKIITKRILSSFDGHQILGEEYGSQGIDEAQWQWVIDPLDGTTNFLRSIAHYAVSIAVLKDGVVEHGVIFDPTKNEMFTASRGKGATLNGLPINVSSSAVNKGGLLATGIPFGGQNLEGVDVFSDVMVDLLKLQTSGIRRLGAAALDLAYVAAGRYEGFWESNLKLWDIAAGVLLVQEAGGSVSDLGGKQNHLNSGDVLAASLGYYEQMLSVCKSHYGNM